MTTGTHLVNLSTLTHGTAMEHFLSIAYQDVYVTKIKEYKVTYAPEELIVKSEKPTYKLVLGQQVYKVVYEPNPTTITREVENVIITKGCNT